MNGSPYAKLGHTYRPKPKKAFSVVTTVAFSCVACTVIILFWMGHSSVMRVHTAMHSPTMEQPAGWATLHKTTTVQSATVTISGSEITGSALTATTTELRSTGTTADPASSQQAASGATASAVAAAAAANVSTGFSSSLVHMLGDLQHSLHAMLTAHAGWKPGAKITRAQLAAAAAASMPDEDRDIELHAHKVAQVVDGAKVAQQLQRLAQGGAAAVVEDGQEELTSAEAFAGLYGAGAGAVSFTATPDLATCPEGSPSPGAAQAAVVLLAGSSTAALKRSLDGLMLLYSRASPDVRSAFHLYVALGSDSSEEMKTVATQYVHDSMGAVKLVQQQDGDSSSSSRGNQQVGSADNADIVAAVGADQHITAGDTVPAGVAGVAATVGARKLLAADPGAVQSSTEKYQQVFQQPVKQQQEPQAHTAADSDSKQPVAASSQTGSSSSKPIAAPTAASTRVSHMQLMLHVFFNCFKYPAALILQDDLNLASDFFDFFYSTYWLLTSDPSLYCLSAWNPQGHRQQAVHPGRVVRSDYHPGKAWLLRRDLGLQLLAKWGTRGSDVTHDGLVGFVQSEGVRGGRQCLVPEMPRVVPAGADETFEGAHIHDPHSAGKTVVGDKEHVILNAADYTVDSSKQAGTTNSGISSSITESGAVDLEAYMDYEQEDNDEDIKVPGENDSFMQDELPIVNFQHGLSPNAGDAGGNQEQQVAKQDGSVGHQAAQRHRAAWLDKDFSILLARNYEAYVKQALLTAQVCDVARAATLTDTHAACVVTYNSAAYLSATAHRLGMPVEVKQGVKYCYNLPVPASAKGSAQHCQDYIPQMAYNGVVTGYNGHSVRIFLVHVQYMEALTQTQGNSATPSVAVGATKHSTSAQAGAKAEVSSKHTVHPQKQPGGQQAGKVSGQQPQRAPRPAVVDAAAQKPVAAT